MTVEKLLRWCERMFARRPPKLVAGTFFSLGMSIVVVGYIRKDNPRAMFVYLLAALAVSAVALGLRWIEKRCPVPSEEYE